MLSLIRRTSSLSGGCSAVHRFRTASSFSNLIASSDSSGLVLLSRSTDVYQNLALEDWVDANVDLQQRSILLLWRNQPAVVIGRHQNPWTECNLPAMRRAGIPLARRRSGGGTVYHDLGNLNLTFFTSKKGYDRQRNLKVVTDALRRIRPELQVQATERFDILLNGHLKISGSASRLSRKSSYHHCTLLHSADRSALSAVLRPSCPGILSNATPSVPSPVTNLVDHAPSLQWEELLEALTLQYNTEFGFSAAATFVNPSEEAVFPGVGRMEAELHSWDWTFGKTPKFTVQTILELTDGQAARCSAQLHMGIKNGVIESCQLDIPADWLPQRLVGELSGVLVGERFCGHRAAAAVTVMLRSESGELQDRLTHLCDALVSAMG
ncbi:lipoyltransferase 1, mitochondrial [Notolabrus celidotus]|uniref:lipoyltransferase 1, mitochondrial n=1 Tax=Notolabrus celidotus TaxID=1203425 RepID=UPI00148FFF06|nr:lipoyltransferase 1, mitochondrial [Notolabrus celidotus]XP_034535200.1 lipoyltransferase 1, mitochondrial [Notolabrus celidotus]XP_034535201.1 lipoyltransferase 1, mitochondrial [Notolabrus celidotus]XP_034535202.1 lipoyltransferase 1, mitochondrial [Notolabrus celidotus]XP_034535204.1 lipoyltransferase 1, mitochondrial [Notolabrus celidotus]XP_034535205.1 lipoyltransferase 1, mitochondrial [Notolabrus celidotus]XP_034535206.1 lipoyltransferase 1, mitochondrial [Notolabrus celidotus]XP_0